MLVLSKQFEYQVTSAILTKPKDIVDSVSISIK